MLWMFPSLALLAILPLAVYLLYLRGLFSIVCKRSLVFLGTPGNSFKNFHRARVTGCTGTVRRVLHFPQGGEYRFSLSLKADRGGMQAILLDKQENLLLRLDGQACQGSLFLSPGENCRLVITFSHMDGSYSLDWEPAQP